MTRMFPLPTGNEQESENENENATIATFLWTGGLPKQSEKQKWSDGDENVPLNIRVMNIEGQLGMSSQRVTDLGGVNVHSLQVNTNNIHMLSDVEVLICGHQDWRSNVPHNRSPPRRRSPDRYARGRVVIFSHFCACY